MSAPNLTEADKKAYEALRTSSGAARLRRDVVVLCGPDAPTYLEGQCSQEVARLPAGATAEALLLAPEGKLVAAVRVARLSPEEFAVEVEGGFGEVVVERLERFKLRSRFDLETRELRGVALRGPLAPREALAPPRGHELALAATWPGFEGVDLLGRNPRDPSSLAARPVTPEAFEARRVEVGLAAMGRELDASTIPAEVPGLLERTVSFTKGCYTGQELVARLDARGNRVARVLRGLVIEGASEVAGLQGAEVVAPGLQRTAGQVTSAAVSPSLGQVVALAFLHRRVEPPATVEVRPTGGEALTAEARPLPLVA